VSSAGVSAHYAAEATEVGDDSPTLAQPEVHVEKGQAFVPFSIELDQDWTTLRAELARLLEDARSTLDATAFLTGSGTDEPEGVLTGLSNAVRVQTASAGTVATGDVYALKAALGARFQANATFAAAPGIYDHLFQLVGGGSSEPAILPTREGALLGRPKIEWTTMDATVAANKKVLIYGDFRHFLIVDRIGSTLEIVPHVFGPNRRPTGQRGGFFYWRSGSAVLVESAFRWLSVKAS
jgi:HK97 family phage major capsid protein